MASKPSPPKGLKPAGAALWRSIVGKWDLRPDELRILREAAREVDLIDVMERELAGDKVMIAGSMGQRVVNPLITELRQHRSTLAQLLRQLKLPDEPGGEQEARSTQARAAANARWATRGETA